MKIITKPPSAWLRWRKKGLSCTDIKMSIKGTWLIVLAISAIVVNSGSAEEMSEKVDLDTYNAQLLMDTIAERNSAPQARSLEDAFDFSEFNETNSDIEEVIGESISSSTSSAISFAAAEESTTTMPLQPRSDRTSQTSWSTFEEEGVVSVNDPELEAVFPQFAEAYNQEEGQQQADLADLDFVDTSDYAVLNEDGSIESYGTSEDLAEAFSLYDEEEPEYYEAEEPDLASFDLGQGGGPTTLMLFNIFSPEEVDFLSTLVGEDAIKDLKDDLPNGTDDNVRQTLEFSTPQSRRPPQFNQEEDESKNANPSSQGIALLGSNTRESLVIYHRPGIQQIQHADDLVEEGKINNTDHLFTTTTISPEQNHELLATAAQRREKMEALLAKLSERYEKTKEVSMEDKEAALDAEIKVAEEKTDKMKVMIENLKYKLSQSRPGVNTIDTKNLDEPLIQSRRDKEELRLYHTTSAPLHIDKVSEMIGEKLRDMQVGMHRLDLDDMLDLDGLSVKSKGSNSLPERPVPPPGTSSHGNNDLKPKRQVIHPKLTRLRPSTGIAHIPSMNLKDYITPATDAPNLAGKEYNQRPIIPRYVDEAIPTPQPFTNNYNEKQESNTAIKQLPQRHGPRLQGYKPSRYKSSDPFPETKELHPYHQPTPTFTTMPPRFGHPDHHKEELPPPPFYSDKHVPGNFDPKAGHNPEPPKDMVAPHLEPQHDFENKYIPSNTYRQPIQPIGGAYEEEGPKEARASKKYAPATYPQYPPPSYDYKQPNIRFDEDHITKPPHIEVTPKNAPKPTSYPAHQIASTYSTTTVAPQSPEHVHTLKTLPPRTYAPPPYRPPSYDSTTPEPYQDPNHHRVTNPKAEHVSSLLPPVRGQIPPVGHRAPPSAVEPPQQAYHMPRPSYVSSMYPPNKGYVPPSSGNYISAYKPPPYASTASPQQVSYQPPASVSSISPPDQGYSTPKPSYVSTMRPPPQSYSSLAPQTIDNIKPSYEHLSHVTAPQKDYNNPMNAYLSTMSPPKQDYHSGIQGQYSTMTPPSESYNGPIHTHMGTLKPPIHLYEKPADKSMSHLKPPAHSYEQGIQTHMGNLTPPPKESYLSPKYGTTQDNTQEDDHIFKIYPPNSSYDQGMKNILAKLSPPEKEYLEHAMSVKSYLPPSEEYKVPESDPPKYDYLDLMAEFMKDMKAPSKEYLAPSPPSYDNPSSQIKELMSPFQPPRQGYLPPEKQNMKPPTTDYEAHISDYLSAYRAPNKDYLPPKTMYEMKPPSVAFEAQSYLSSMKSPDKDYSEPNQLLPELASYLSPIQKYMAQLLPPKTEHLPKQPSLKPPHTDYLTPMKEHESKLKPPTGDYLVPLKNNFGSMNPPKQEYTYPKDPRMMSLFPPEEGYKAQHSSPNLLRTICPPPNKNAKCEYSKHQCGNVGLPDTNCPGSGLCCFNGCINACLPPHTGPPIFTELHVPPNPAYLIPGQEHFYLSQLFSKRRNEEEPEQPAQQYLPPSNSVYAHPQLENPEESKELPGLPIISQLPRSKPSLEFRPPQDNYQNHEEKETHYQPPNRDYLAPSEGYKLPSYTDQEIEDLQKPSTHYLPPVSGYEVAHENVYLRHQGSDIIHPPSNEYLPPNEFTQYKPPSDDYSAPQKMSHLQPPLEEHHLPDKMYKYQPPTIDYLPPDHINKYQAPALDYHPPKDMYEMSPPQSDYGPPRYLNQFRPPSSSYGLPQGMTRFGPPSKDYLPPKNAHLELAHTTTTLKPVHFSRGALASAKVPMIPPTEEHLPRPSSLSGGEHFRPPSKDYIPPTPIHGNDKVPMVPPQDEYIPALPHSNDSPITIEGASLLPPSSDYLVPQSNRDLTKHHDRTHMVPMVPPSHDAFAHNSEKNPNSHQGALIQPPSKDYIPPKSHHEEPQYTNNRHNAQLTPPQSDYIPPSNHHQSQNHAQMVPPSNDNHPPNIHYQQNTESHGMFLPPSHDYIPPPTPEAVLDIHQNVMTSYRPPSKEYIPPQATQVEPHKVDQNFHSFQPPSKEYLPPPSTAIETIGHAIHIAEHHEHHVTAPPEIARNPTHTVLHNQDYHITATLNNGLDHHSMTHHSEVGPHSINIQINMPDKHHEVHGGSPRPDPHPTLFRTSKPPNFSSDAPVYHPEDNFEKVMPNILPVDHTEEAKIMPHMLPHSHVHAEKMGYDGKIMPHMLPHSKNPKSLIGPPPTLPDYIPPPLSTHTDGYGSYPKHLDYHLPPRQYHPIHHELHPKEYLPTNPLVYRSPSRKPSHSTNDPEFELEDPVNPMQQLRPPNKDYLAPGEVSAPVKGDGYIPPGDEGDYLPPSEKEELEIPSPPDPESLPADIDDGLPSRGPQFPTSEQFRIQREKDYASPPRRPSNPDIEDILNSQVLPPGRTKEHYIPPKTKFDVPKNFVRPEDAFDAPLISEVDEFGTIDILDDAGLPSPPSPNSVPEQVGDIAEQLTEQPFLGLAKLVDVDRKKSLKELEELRDEVKKLAKLVEKPKGPQLPPIPTVPSVNSLPPQPSSFLPFLEKLQPSVLQQLQSNIRTQSGQDGKIPGKPGVDYPDFKTIPATDFSCENFLLEGFYADTFTSCQVFHVCESGKRQSSFLCPRGTIFNQKHRVCDWWYNVKCEDATEFYDLNLDLLLLEKGVSPTQATNLNVPPPIDTISEVQNNVDSGLFDSNSGLNLLTGSDVELDSLILDDLVLSNLLGNRRSDSGEDSLSMLSKLLGQSKSQLLNPLPSSVAAPVQPQPLALRKRKNRPRRRKKSESEGGGSLCQIMNICDSVPSATQEEPKQSSPHHDMPFASSQNHHMIVDAPEERGKRLGEKTASEVAALFAGSNQRGLEVDEEVVEDADFGASSMIINTSFPMYKAIDFSEGSNVNIDEPEGYRMSNHGEDANDQHVEGNRPIAFINFENYNEERQSKMIADPESATLNLEELTPPTNTHDSEVDSKDFALKHYNLDRDGKTWRPLRKLKSGELERTDVSASMDESEWVPKSGPDSSIRET